MGGLDALTNAIRRDLLAYLRRNVVGRESAVTVSDLAVEFRTCERVIREWCGSEEFIETGVCTASSPPYGVWVAATPDEYDAAIGHQVARLVALRKRVDLMRAARARLFGGYGPLFAGPENEVA
jgi:hypothetical protein